MNESLDFFKNLSPDLQRTILKDFFEPLKDKHPTLMTMYEKLSSDDELNSDFLVNVFEKTMEFADFLEGHEKEVLNKSHEKMVSYLKNLKEKEKNESENENPDDLIKNL